MVAQVHSNPDVFIADALLRHIRDFIARCVNELGEDQVFVLIYFAGRRELNREMSDLMSRVAGKISVEDYVQIWEYLYKLSGRCLPDKFEIIATPRDGYKYQYAFNIGEHEIKINLDNFDTERKKFPIKLDYDGYEIVEA
ncbi:hypothetical protein [Methylobacterium sp. Leaf94]|uniref:hypothetical protein n=1 Tax=Methylobacterium sp. Leaf94 TaxID=1736250 RepID=UPI0012E33F6C|nr:hypothetical protein [Methylobacterium sp. Leaf94]